MNKINTENFNWTTIHWLNKLQSGMKKYFEARINSLKLDESKR